MFQCQRTGECCKSPSIIPTLTHRDILTLFNYWERRFDRLLKCFSFYTLEQLLDEDLTRLVVHPINTTRGKILIGLRKDPNGKCIFFENKSCQIYPQRPLSCRNYPFAFLGTASGIEVTLVKNSNESCDGIGKGNAIPMTNLKTIGKKTLKEIEAFRKVIEEINFEDEKGRPLRPRETVWILIAYAEKFG